MFQMFNRVSIRKYPNLLNLLNFLNLKYTHALSHYRLEHVDDPG